MDESGARLDKALARSEVEGEVRAEYAEAARHLLDSERDKRMLVLGVQVVFLGSLMLPLIALVLGFSWRVMMWAAGG